MIVRFCTDNVANIQASPVFEFINIQNNMTQLEEELVDPDFGEVIANYLDQINSCFNSPAQVHNQLEVLNNGGGG